MESTGPTGDIATGATGDIATGATGDIATGPTGDIGSGPTGDIATGPTGDIATEPTDDIGTGPTGDIATGPTGMESTGPTGDIGSGATGMESTEPTDDIATGATGMESTGPTGDIGTGATGMEPPPDILSLDDILNDTSVKQAKEEEDRQTLLSIGAQSPQALRPALLQWAKQGFPAGYPIMTISIQPPTLCSDGVYRGLEEYIQFLSGKNLFDHVQDLQAKLTGMTLGFVNMGSYLNIVVSKP